MSLPPDEPSADAPDFTHEEWQRALALGLDEVLTERVAVLLAGARAEALLVYQARLDRAVARQRELRDERDQAEALLDEVAKVVTYPSCYFRADVRPPRFVMHGKDVLNVLQKRVRP